MNDGLNRDRNKNRNKIPEAEINKTRTIIGLNKDDSISDNTSLNLK